jgi:hypothetical protein
MKHFYFIHRKDECEGIVIVARSHKEAKANNYSLIDGDYIDIRTDRYPQLVPPDMALGEIDEWYGLFHGLYETICEPCPHCNKLDDDIALNHDVPIAETPYAICRFCQQKICLSDVWEAGQ